MPPSFDHLASTQLGLITRAQLRDLAWSDRQVDHALTTSRLFAVRRGVYRVPGAPTLADHEVLAPILATDEPGSVFASLRTAGAQWGLKYALAPHRVSLATRRRMVIEGVDARHTIHLPDADVTTLGPIPLTTPSRTICDLAAQLHQRALGLMLDDARRRGLVRMYEVDQTYRRLREIHPNRRGLRKIAAVLAERAGQTSAGGSAPELDVWAILRKSGLPMPVQQYEVIIAGQRHYLDFAYPEWRIAVEYDSFEFHAGTPDDFKRTTEKKYALDLDGWLYVPILKGMREQAVVDRVEGAIAIRTREQTHS